MLIALICLNGLAEIWDAPTGRVIWGQTYQDIQPGSITWEATSKRLALGCQDGRVQFQALSNSTADEVVLLSRYPIQDMRWGERHKEHRITSIAVSELNPLKQLASAFRWANVRWFLLAWFFYAFPVGMLQTTITVLMKDSLGFNATQASLVVTMLGAVDILVQGVLVGRLLARLGNIQLGPIAFVLVGISYLVLGSLALLATPLLLLVGIMLFAGSGRLVENALRGLLSGMVGRREQGRVSGATQSLQSLGWVIGPLVGGFVYTAWGPFQAYAFASFLIVLAIVCVWIALPLLQRHQAKEQTSGGEQESSLLSNEEN